MSQALQPEGVDPSALTDRLFELWTCKDLEGLRLEAAKGFSELGEPLAGLLEMLERCPGPQKGKSSTLGQFVMGEFVRWRPGRPRASLEGVSAELLPGLQRRALGLVCERQTACLEPLLDVYQLGRMDRSELVEHVGRLWDSCSYREAAVLAMKLELQPDLDMEKMCVPLVLLDKLAMAEAYVRGRALLQERLVTLLDSWCCPHFSLDQLRKQYPRLCLSKHQTDLIQPKMVTKHVFRLMEKFNVDPAKCSNSVHKRKFDSLRFLMHMHFREGKMSEENWSDHVQAIVEGSVELQVHLVEQLVRHGSLQQAAEWAAYYSLPKNRLPFGVWDTLQTLPPSQTGLPPVSCPSLDSWEPSQHHRQHYYQLPVTRGNVHFLSTLEQLESCQQAVIQPGAVVGVDMEWRAGFGTVSQQRVALIQLAVPGSVFLLDLCAPAFSQSPQTLRFIRDLLAHKNVLKLGYGMSGDLRSLVATWPEFSEQPLKVEGMLDLLHVHQKIQMSRRGGEGGPRSVEVGDADSPGRGGGSSEKGLSLLVQQVLSRPLDKQEQLSNWERRPLRLAQLRYAAADAYCLLDVHSVLKENHARYGLPSDLLSLVPRPSDAGQKKEERAPKDKSRKGRKKTKDCDQAPAAELLSLRVGSGAGEGGPPVAPQELRVVCDNMLQGLGRYLRCLGVNTVILENVDDHKVAAKLARTEDRVILTSGQPYQTLKSQVAEGRCLALDCSEKARDQAVQVLRHFHVRLTPQDIFSRCQACNNDEYLRLPQKTMATLMTEKGLVPEQPLPSAEAWDDHYEPLLPYNSWRGPEAPTFTPHCRWAPEGSLDARTLAFPGGAVAQLDTVPPGLLPRIPEFFVRTGCGKVFWEGTHFDRVLSQFEDVLHIGEDAVAAATDIATTPTPTSTTNMAASATPDLRA
ncbi:exonuclease mut-7 homolog isoform X2 [Sardina pilchardus]|uniref:exonuclease mut-7 homolog isoform X2 n=1 Tax=Sardina pilchardus TaxID=27697 RepID=UPI002E15AA33